MVKSKTMITQTETTIAPSDPGFAELDFRAGEGVQVALLWERSSNAAVVAVLDRKGGQYFEMPVEPG